MARVNLPRVDVVLAQPCLRGHPAGYALKKRAVQEALAQRRALLREAVSEDRSEDAATVAEAVASSLRALLMARPRALINATGVLLHTNLGAGPAGRGGGGGDGGCGREL